MSKTYEAAVAILGGTTVCPQGMDHKIWYGLRQRHAEGRMHVTHYAGLVCQTAEEARIADYFATGHSMDAVIQMGYSARTVTDIYRIWRRHGRPAPANAQDRDGEATTVPNTGADPSGPRFLSRLFRALGSLDSLGPDDIEQLVKSPEGTAFVTGMGDSLTKIASRWAVPAYYLSVREDRERNQPFEVSFSLTLRQKEQSDLVSECGAPKPSV